MVSSINFFILHRQAEMITWQFILAIKQEYKRGILFRWDETYCMQSQDVIYEELPECQDPSKAGQDFIPANRDHVITTLA